MSSSNGKKHVLRMREARKDSRDMTPHPPPPPASDIQGRLMKED